MAGAVFPFSFLFLFLNRSLPLPPIRFAQGGEEETFALGLVREKTIDRMVIFQRAGDLPFVLYGGDGQCFGSQFFRYMMDVLFILLRVVGTGAIDQQTAGFQRVPDVVDDAAPASGTERDVRDAPFACTVGIFAKHTFAGTGHVGDDHVKEMRKAADLFRIVASSRRNSDFPTWRYFPPGYDSGYGSPHC